MEGDMEPVAEDPAPETESEMPSVETQLMIQLLNTIQAQISDNHTALLSQMNEGMRGIMARQDTTNGRLRAAEGDIRVLQEKTSNMVCVAHTETFKRVEEKVDALIDEDIPGRLKVIEHDHAKQDAAPEPRSRAKAWTIGATSLAGLGVLLEAVWTWWTRK